MSKITRGNLGNFINLGYVRTLDDEVGRIIDLIEPTGPGPLRVVDPCCGKGLALAAMGRALAERHGIEVATFGTEADQERAEEAKKRVDQCLWAPYQDARWDEGSMDVMLLNPPYAGGELELQFLREMQDTLRPDGLLFYIIRQQNLNGHIAARLAGHFDVLSVYAFLPDNFEAFDQVVVVARKREKRRMDKGVKAQLRAIGRQAKDAENAQMLLAAPAPGDEALWGYPEAPFEVKAPGRGRFYLRHREAKPEQMGADAKRFGARTSRWWNDRIGAERHLKSSTLLPLRDTQIANLLLLGFADNREFRLEGRRYLFRGQTHLDKTDVTSEEDQAEGRTRVVETVKQGGVMLSLETGQLREVDTQGILHLVRHHAGAFARAVTDQVPALRPQMTLEPWEETCLDQVYRFQRLPGRAEYGLTHVQKVISAVTAQAIEEKTPVVVLNSDTGAGKTGCAYGAALCLRRNYLKRQSYRWFSGPEHRGGNRRRRMRMKGSGGSERAWMRSYNHAKPFCIAFAAEPHTLNKMAQEARACLPMATVRVAEDVSQVEAFVELTRELDHRSIAVLIVPKSMAKLGEGWTWAAFRAHGIGEDEVDRKRPYHCPDCGAVAVYHERGEKGEDTTYPIYEDDVQATLASTPMRCEACDAPLWQFCRTDFRTGKPLVFSPDDFFAPDHKPGASGTPPVRHPVAHYIAQRFQDFFDLVIWDEAHDCNGVGTDIVAAYRQLTGAARRGWIELTASNMNGKASGVFTRAFHASPEVRRRFQFDERAEFVETYGVHEYITRLVQETNEAGRYMGRVRQVTTSREAPGVQPHLTLLMVPHTITTMIEDLGAPLPPRLEACDEFSTTPADSDPFADVVAQYRRLSDVNTQRHRRAKASQYQACLAYLNAPWNRERITEIVRDEKTDRIVRDSEGRPLREVFLEVEPTWDIHDDRLLPKEEKLLEELDRALSEGHGISVMIAHVERGIQERLTWLIDRHLGKGTARYCTAPARRREAWYAQAVRDDVKVIISHPRKLRTGLDLIHYPWIYFYQPVSNLYTMIQAKGRAWRLGQRWPCETHFFYYANTEEHSVLQQQADKMISDNLLRGGDLSGGLMGMGQQMTSVEATREALSEGDLRHLGVLFEQEAVGEWVPPERIEAYDQSRRRESRQRLVQLREKNLEAIQKSFQMALF